MSVMSTWSCIGDSRISPSNATIFLFLALFSSPNGASNVFVTRGSVTKSPYLTTRRPEWFGLPCNRVHGCLVCVDGPLKVQNAKKRHTIFFMKSISCMSSASMPMLQPVKYLETRCPADCSLHTSIAPTTYMVAALVEHIGYSSVVIFGGTSPNPVFSPCLLTF